MEPQLLNWTCDECANTSKATWVVLSDIQMDRAIELETRIASPSHEPATPISAEELMKLDYDPGMWSAMCTSHANKFSDDGYVFETSRIDTAEKALDWTLHLLDKGWLDKTDWSDFLRSKFTKDLDA